MHSQKLTSTQHRYLKQQAHHLKPLMQMGKEGPTPSFTTALGEQLLAHELLKFRVLNNCLASKEDICAMVANAEARLIQQVGHVYTVFKQRTEDSWFKLPK